MSANAIVSAANDRRIRRAQAWLENRAAAEEVLIVGATLDAANELARKVAKRKALRSAGIGSRCRGWLSRSLRPFWQRVVSPRSAESARTPSSLGSCTG